VSRFSLDHDQYNFASNHLLSAAQTEHQLSPFPCTSYLRSFPFPFVTLSLSRPHRLGIPLCHMQLNLPFHITSPSYRDPSSTTFNIDSRSSSYSLNLLTTPLILLFYQHQHYLYVAFLPTATYLLAFGGSCGNRTDDLNTDSLQIHLSLNR
jgi:hypothetical protein